MCSPYGCVLLCMNEAICKYFTWHLLGVHTDSSHVFFSCMKHCKLSGFHVYIELKNVNITHKLPHEMCKLWRIPLQKMQIYCHSIFIFHTHAHIHTHRIYTMLLPVKLSLGFTAVTHFPIFSLWSVTVQMMIIRELYSHLITDIMNWVSRVCLRACVCVCVCAFLHVQIYVWDLMLIHSCDLVSHWLCFSGLSQQRYREFKMTHCTVSWWTCCHWWVVRVLFKHMYAPFDWQQKNPQYNTI